MNINTLLGDDVLDDSYFNELLPHIQFTSLTYAQTLEKINNYSSIPAEERELIRPLMTAVRVLGADFSNLFKLEIPRIDVYASIKNICDNKRNTINPVTQYDYQDNFHIKFILKKILICSILNKNGYFDFYKKYKTEDNELDGLVRSFGGNQLKYKVSSTYKMVCTGVILGSSSENKIPVQREAYKVEIEDVILRGYNALGFSGEGASVVFENVGDIGKKKEEKKMQDKAYKMLRVNVNTLYRSYFGKI